MTFGRHRGRLERTLLPVAFDVDFDLAFDRADALPMPLGRQTREGHDVQSCRKANTTVEERRFSAA